MIVACPQCEAKYRVDPNRVGPEGARLRCAKCESVFRIEAPAVDPLPQPVATPQPPAATAPQPSAEQQPAPDRDRMVLIADSDSDSAKTMANALSSWGLEPVMVLDGVEAMLSIQRLLPKVVVLDVGLTKMYGFQVCEMVKRNDSLRHIKVVLIGSVHHVERYRRPPVELYGADVYLEKPDIPDALLPSLRRFGFPVPGEEDGGGSAAPISGGAPPTPEPTPDLEFASPPGEEPEMQFDPAPSEAPVAHEPTLPSVEPPPSEPAPSFEFEESAPALELTEPAPPEEPAFAASDEPVFGSEEEPVFATDDDGLDDPQFGDSDDVEFGTSDELEFDMPEEPAAPEVELPAPVEPEAPVDPELQKQRETAERLARIIVSDIILYNPDKFEAAVASGNVVEALEGDLAEGRRLFQQRVDERVREEKDHLREELLRVAREKGMA